MNLSEILTEECISLDLQEISKNAVVREMANLATRSGRVSDEEELVKALLAREELQTTGIGYGMAIPHATTESVRGLTLAMGVSRSGIDYDSIDRQPVHLVFVLAGEPRMQTSFLSILGKISRLFRTEAFREQIRNASSPSEILTIIQSSEEN